MKLKDQAMMMSSSSLGLLLPHWVFLQCRSVLCLIAMFKEKARPPRSILALVTEHPYSRDSIFG